VRCEYEYRDDSGQWYRGYGNENWEFNEFDYMKFRYASINDLPIKEADRKLRWERKSGLGSYRTARDSPVRH
jgi:nuclear transport factor 2 (NTF2) superfamily protein